MRHRKAGLKLNRTASHRKAMFRNMVTSLLKFERIRTTDTKAKELRKWADHIITLAKRGDLHARRQALAIVTEKNVVHKLFETAAERFGSVNGGYTRVIKIGRRAGDAAPLSLIELIAVEKTKSTKKKKKTKTAGTKQAKAAKSKAKVEADKDGASAIEDSEGKKPKSAAAKKAAPEKKPESAKKAAPKADEKTEEQEDKA